MVRGLVSVVIGGLVLCGARVALAGPCEDRAELHYAIASQLEAEGMSAEPLADSAWEDAMALCLEDERPAAWQLTVIPENPDKVAHPFQVASEYVKQCNTPTAWVKNLDYPAGGANWVAVCGDENGNPLVCVGDMGIVDCADY